MLNSCSNENLYFLMMFMINDILNKKVRPHWDYQHPFINLYITVKFYKSLGLCFFNKLEHVNHFSCVLRLGKSTLPDSFKFRYDSANNTKMLSKKFILSN